jgi:hypothetical protein
MSLGDYLGYAGDRRTHARNRAIRIGCGLVTHKRACSGRSEVEDGSGSILSDHMNIKSY